MGKIKDIIARVDDAKFNEYSQQTKLRWLSLLDGQIASDVYLMAPEETAQYAYPYPDGLNMSPLVDFPNDDIYDLWLIAQIEFHNGEYEKYQNTMEMFNSAYGRFVNWFLTYKAPEKGLGRCDGDVGGGKFYYITAYGLAVKHGFKGTIEEWFASLKGEEGGPIISGLSEGSANGGKDAVAGLLGYYYSAIDFENKTVTLSEKQDSAVAPAEPIAWAVGDVVSIVNGTKYELCATITTIDGNVITLDKIPFESVVEDANPNFDDWSIAVPDKPGAGVVDLGKGAVAIGDGCKALNWGAAAIGGRDNTITAEYGTIDGGRENRIDAYAGYIGGGKGNWIPPGFHFGTILGTGNTVTALGQVLVGLNLKPAPDVLIALGNGVDNKTLVVKEDGTAEAFGKKLINITDLQNALYTKQNAITAWPTKNLDDRYGSTWMDIPSGLYKIGEGTAGGPANVNINYGHLLNWRLGNTHSQIVIPIYKDSAGVWFRTGNNEDWGDGWIALRNPPMLIGVEYLTSEFYNGKPVYKKIVNIGALPNASERKVSHGIVGAKTFISVDVMAYDTGSTITQQFPFVATDGGVRGRVHITAEALYLHTYTNVSYYNAVATVSYIKA